MVLFSEVAPSDVETAILSRNECITQISFQEKGSGIGRGKIESVFGIIDSKVQTFGYYDFILTFCEGSLYVNKVIRGCDSYAIYVEDDKYQFKKISTDKLTKFGNVGVPATISFLKVKKSLYCVTSNTCIDISDSTGDIKSFLMSKAVNICGSMAYTLDRVWDEVLTFFSCTDVIKYVISFDKAGVLLHYAGSVFIAEGAEYYKLLCCRDKEGNYKMELSELDAREVI